MIYLDNAATTPVPRAVADAMYQVLTEQFGNPSSQYPMGVEMKAAVERWRAVIAGALGCKAESLYFTSCGTESDNWAIQAALWQNRHKGKHIITTAVEHSAVLEPCRWLAQQGYEITCLKPGRDGNITALIPSKSFAISFSIINSSLINKFVYTSFIGCYGVICRRYRASHLFSITTAPAGARSCRPVRARVSVTMGFFRFRLGLYAFFPSLSAWRSRYRASGV